MKIKTLQSLFGAFWVGGALFLIPASLSAQVITNQIPTFRASMELTQTLCMSGIGLVLLLMLIFQRNNKLVNPWVGFLSYLAILILLILFALSIMGRI